MALHALEKDRRLEKVSMGADFMIVNDSVAADGSSDFAREVEERAFGVDGSECRGHDSE